MGRRTWSHLCPDPTFLRPPPDDRTAGVHRGARGRRVRAPPEAHCTAATLCDGGWGRGCGGPWEVLAVAGTVHRTAAAEHRQDPLRLRSGRAREGDPHDDPPPPLPSRSTTATLRDRDRGRGCGGGGEGLAVGITRRALPRPPPPASKLPGPGLPRPRLSRRLPGAGEHWNISTWND